MFPRMRRVAGGLVCIVVFASATLAAGCKGPMAKIDAVRESLERDDSAAIASATEGYPACADAPPLALLPTQPSPRDTGCFADIANALGSKKGFVGRPPDHAATTTVAIVLLRDGRGDWVAHVEDWLGSIKTGKGSGPDTLRMAVARKMAEAAPRIGRKLEEEKDALEAMKAVAGAIPGARLVPLATLAGEVQSWDRSQKYVMVCKSGKRSEQAAQKLIAAGFSEIALLEGGTDAWVASGFRVHTAEKRPWSLERQVRVVAGTMVVISALLGLALSPWFFSWTVFVGAGLVFAGVTDTCMMAAILGRMPWNRDSCSAASCAA